MRLSVRQPILPAPRPRVSGGIARNTARYVEHSAHLQALFRLAHEHAEPPEEWPVSVTIYLAAGSGDVDNCSKTVLDAMVKAGVLPDDTRKYVSRLIIEAHHGEYTTMEIETIQPTKPRGPSIRITQRRDGGEVLMHRVIELDDVGVPLPDRWSVTAYYPSGAVEWHTVTSRRRALTMVRAEG
jgi:Holliday junction resolvase RusA-like endonuclease